MINMKAYFEKFYLGGSNTLRAYKLQKFEQDTISTGVGSDDTLAAFWKYC